MACEHYCTYVQCFVRLEVSYGHDELFGFSNTSGKTLDKVNDDHVPVLITRQNGKPAVVISLEDFHAYEETAYLMASPKNAARLNEAIAEIEAGHFAVRDLVDP